MQLIIPANRRLAKQLGEQAVRFLESGLNAITRILPHIETVDWKIGSRAQSAVSWRQGTQHRQADVVLGIGTGDGHSICCTIQRRSVPKGVGQIHRTLDPRELEICDVIVSKLARIFENSQVPDQDTISGMQGVFEELVVADHLKTRHNIELDPGRIIGALRRLAEQTYENKPLTFGCLVDSTRSGRPSPEAGFPDDWLSKKRFRALSDAYYTAYLVSGAGKLEKFIDLQSGTPQAAPRNYFPEWCRDLALRSRDGRIGFALTRHGDLLVFDGGTLRFSYRFGTWQYWNHSHLVDLIKNSARVQRVPRNIIPRVANALYRAALDVSFRRTGGLFVILRNRQRIDQLVRAPDRVGHSDRPVLNAEFDDALPGSRIQSMPRSVVVELAALDGALVLNNHGEVLAYGAILNPKRRGKADAEEGSRTKAAIGASNYGLAVKVSSDGDITLFVGGKKFIRV